MSYDVIFKELLDISLQRKIPLLRPESSLLLQNVVTDNKVKSVLEIGSATGVTAFKIEQLGVSVTSIEKDATLYQLCLSYKEKLQSKVDFICGDATIYNFTQQYDLVFIDAGKAHYQKYFDNTQICQPNYYFIDNVNFGLKDINSYPKRLQPICKKMTKFINSIKSLPDYDFKLFNIEDGVILLTKK